ncbi:MAG: PhzF family phenazine biosynthesis protein [Methanomicrobiales archaeon]
MVLIATVDAFTATPFRGNPAGVCILPGPVDDSWMEQVAAEMNLSETAFVAPQGRHFNLRWFTPATEVELCGHATLAAAHLLWERDIVPPMDPIRFYTRAGILMAYRDGKTVWLDLPANPPLPAEVPADLPAMLGVEPLSVHRCRSDLLVEVAREADVRELAPDIRALAAFPGSVIVTAPSDREDADFVSRVFAPAEGIDEDPVTGSAHCALGPFWTDRLGRIDLVGYQASRRGGYVQVNTAGDRVEIGGEAVTVLLGDLLPPAG